MHANALSRGEADPSGSPAVIANFPSGGVEVKEFRFGRLDVQTNPAKVGVELVVSICKDFTVSSN